MKPKFILGRTLATPGALAALEESGQSPAFFLGRHIQGDWGDLCDEDKALNDSALVRGETIMQTEDCISAKSRGLCRVATKGRFTDGPEHILASVVSTKRLSLGGG